MSRPASQASWPMRPGDQLAGSNKCSPPDTSPIGTYIKEISNSDQQFGTHALHPARLFCEVLSDELLLLRFPPFAFSMRVNDRLNVLFNVSSLFALVVQGNRAENQTIEDSIDISLRSACDTHMQIRNWQFEKLPNKMKYIGTGRADGG